MTNTNENSKWEAAAGQRPQLQEHVQTVPQTYRGVRWYILRNELTGQNLRLNFAAYDFAGRLDGKCTVEQVLSEMARKYSDEAPTQEEALHILEQLFSMGLTHNEQPSNSDELAERATQSRILRRRRKLMNPLSIRIPLLDPDKFLEKCLPLVKPLFSKTCLVLWSILLTYTVLLATTHAKEIGAAINSDVLAPDNLLIMLVIFIGIKTVHEFAHAFAVKLWGGEVHEMGITFLVLAPVPYVDASAAWAFRDKYRRILVSAVGIMMELLIASLAFLVWLGVEPGLVKDAAFNAVLIGGVSTLLFNANPLLRFDGYYIFQDLIEIPNLYTRSGRLYIYLAQKYLYGQSETNTPATSKGETAWFLAYGLGAFIYRNVLLFSIVLFLIDQYLFIGVALGSWSILMQVVLPLIRILRYLYSSPTLLGHRKRAIINTIALTAFVTTSLTLIPVSRTTQAEGVVWVSEQAQVYAGTAGFVSEVFVQSGEFVDENMPIMQMRSPSLDANIRILEAKAHELQIIADAEYIESGGRSESTLEEIKSNNLELTMLREQQSDLLVKSKLAGTFILPSRVSIQSTYLKQGDFVGYVFEADNLIIKSVIAQSDIGLVRQAVENIEVRLAGRLNDTLQASVHRETPSGSSHLPSRALGTSGGGRIAIKTRDENGTTATEDVFQLELKTDTPLNTPRIGERAYVRIEHTPEALAKQWAHGFRQLILSRLSV